MELYSDLIPHEDFHKGIWLSSNNTSWYYFLKTDRDFIIPNTKNFYDTLDPNLKNLVCLLHNNDFPTTPSCTGHHKSKSYYSNMYDSILNNSKLINKQGDIFYDHENNKKYFYRNPNYSLPWNKDEFINKIMDYQQKGVLGIVDPYDIIYHELSDDNISKDNDITLIFTKSKNPVENKNVWNSIYDKIKLIF